MFIIEYDSHDRSRILACQHQRDFLPVLEVKVCPFCYGEALVAIQITMSFRKKKQKKKETGNCSNTDITSVKAVD